MQISSGVRTSALILTAVAAWGQPPAAPQLPGMAGRTLSQNNYTSITGPERFKWFVMSTVGPTSLLAAGPISAGWGTMLNSPEEYGPHWEGFGKRYGMRLTGVSTGNAIEATLGAALREDPRYVHAAPGTPFGRRVKYVIVSSFLAHKPDGSTTFSISRIAGNVGNNYLSNLWRVESQSSAGDAAMRCVWGLTSRMSSYAFMEFWPDVRRRLRRK